MGRRKSRWDDEKVVIPGMPTILPENLTPEQERLYLLQLQIEELTLRLRTNDLRIPPEGERSPSPEPVYDNNGKRLNTREVRAIKKLEDERHFFITKMLNENPLYKPPADYRPPVIKIREKVLIPQEDFPDINFVGLLIGPRGNTLKSMEKESGAKIIIRGKGSVKEGKSNRTDGQPAAIETEPLHALVTGTTDEQVRIAVDRIKEIVRQGIEVPENKNDLRRTQLRQLAMLNGTLRENDNRCINCGSSTHKSWQCPEKPNITNRICCSNCGGVGHLLRDCKEPRRSMLNPTGTFEPGSSALTEDQAAARRDSHHGGSIDEDYEKFMAELGES
jgi:splicing factor 1